MTKRDHIIKRVIQVTGIISSLIFIIAKIDVLIPYFAERDYSYGNLYDFCKVSDYKIPIPQKIRYQDTVTVKNPAEADVLLIGDSYTVTEYGHAPFPVLIGDRLKKKIFLAKFQNLYLNIPDVLKMLNTGFDKQKRVLIVESTERYILDRFGKNINYYNPNDTLVSSTDILKKLYSNFFMGAENNYNYLIDFNILFNKFNLIEGLATARFKLGGVIASATPRYSADPPMLFYKEYVEYFYRKVNDVELKLAVSNMKKYVQKFNEKNIRVIFVLVPEGYMLYHYYINNHTGNNTIPRLQKLFDLNHLDYVDIYHSFAQSDSILYWNTDTHWNVAGYKLATELIAKKCM